MKDFQQYFHYGILWWSILPVEDIMTIVFNGSRTWEWMFYVWNYRHSKSDNNCLNILWWSILPVEDILILVFNGSPTWEWLIGMSSELFLMSNCREKWKRTHVYDTRQLCHIKSRGRLGCDRMVVRFTTTCAISAHHH